MLGACFLASLLPGGVFIPRTALEDRELQKRLDGYRDFGTLHRKVDRTCLSKNSAPFADNLGVDGIAGTPHEILLEKKFSAPCPMPLPNF